MIQKTFCVLLLKIILFIGFTNPQQEIVGLHIPKSEWIGLGFYLTRYPQNKEPNFYKDCFEDANFFMQANYFKLNSKLFTANKWLKGGNLELINQKNKKIYCKVDSEGYFPELVFFKDLLDIRKNFNGKTVWSRKHFFYSRDAKGKAVRYKLPRFCQLKITAVNLAPKSQNVSIRIDLETADGYPGFLDINYSGINRKPPYNGLERYLFLHNPQKSFQIINANWDLIKMGQTSLGMSIQEVEMSLGKPKDKFIQGEETILVYPSSQMLNQHFIFYEDHLVEKKSATGDSF